MEPANKRVKKGQQENAIVNYASDSSESNDDDIDEESSESENEELMRNKFELFEGRLPFIIMI